MTNHVVNDSFTERRSPNRRSPPYVEVITGRGKRSRDGKPRIKPAVIDYLRRKGYRYILHPFITKYSCRKHILLFGMTKILPKNIFEGFAID